MRTTTGALLVTAALRKIGAYAPGETPSPTEITNGVSAANDLIDDWATQDLTVSYKVRELFDLVVGQQTYSIGAGGDFDTVRPQAIDAAAILINPASVLSVASITRASTTATVTLPGHGYQSGANIKIAGANQSAYNGTVIITVTSSSVFTYTVSGSPTTPATGTITAQDAIGIANEQFMACLTYQAYINIVVKGLLSTFPMGLWYNLTYANEHGTIYTWPMPSQFYQLVLYSGRILSQVDEDTSIILPPAAARALLYNIAVELIPEYGRDESQMATVIAKARESLANFKRSNFTLEVLSTGELGAAFGHGGSYISPFDFYAM